MFEAIKSMLIHTQQPIVPIVPVEQPEQALKISEPVMSIISEMMNIDNWIVTVKKEDREYTYRFQTVSKTLEHKINGKRLKFFFRDYHYPYQEKSQDKYLDIDWVTEDESAALFKALEDMNELFAQRKKEESEMWKQYEREQWMVFVKEK